MRLNEIIKLLRHNEYHTIQQAIGMLEAMQPEKGEHEETIYLDCGVLGELECEVSFDYTPAVPEAFEHPSEKEYYEIRSVMIYGTDFVNLIATDIIVKKLKKVIYEN
jgi:hypothetical protein